MVAVVLVCAAVGSSGNALTAQSRPSDTTLSGDAQKGKALFNDAYACGSCHGVRGTAGTPRIVPMSRSQSEFARFIRKPTAAAMPAFADATDQQLADVYAYIKSITVPPLPPLESFPILNDVMKTVR